MHCCAGTAGIIAHVAIERAQPRVVRVEPSRGKAIDVGRGRFGLLSSHLVARAGSYRTVSEPTPE